MFADWGRGILERNHSLFGFFSVIYYKVFLFVLRFRCTDSFHFRSFNGSSSSSRSSVGWLFLVIQLTECYDLKFEFRIGKKQKKTETENTHA